MTISEVLSLFLSFIDGLGIKTIIIAFFIAVTAIEWLKRLSSQ